MILWIEFFVETGAENFSIPVRVEYVSREYDNLCQGQWWYVYMIQLIIMNNLYCWNCFIGKEFSWMRKMNIATDLMVNYIKSY